MIVRRKSQFLNSFQDEGDWRCTVLAGKESAEGGEGEETCCGLVVYVPKSYRVPTFLGRVQKLFL